MTSITVSTLTISIDDNEASVWSTQCKKIGMSTLNIGICLTITNKSII